MAGQQRDPRSVRPPAVAGMFYPAEADACRALARSFVQPDAAPPEQADNQQLWTGGIVPHAGWVCSGAIAGRTMAALARSLGPVDVVVVFGAVHSPTPIHFAALDPHALWAVPSGESQLPEQLERRLTETSDNLFRVDERFHRREHAVEVELPLVQAAWPAAAVLPVEVPLFERAPDVGAATARQLERAGLSAAFLASSDLTHYGPAYRFAPHGVGLAGLEWAKDNDRRVLSLVTDMAVDRVVPEVAARLNACGGGAIAAMMAACRERGATRGLVLRHANSFETLADVAPQPSDNAVGYAAVVVGR